MDERIQNIVESLSTGAGYLLSHSYYPPALIADKIVDLNSEGYKIRCIYRGNNRDDLIAGFIVNGSYIPYTQRLQYIIDKPKTLYNLSIEERDGRTVTESQYTSLKKLSHYKSLTNFLDLSYIDALERRGIE